MVLQTNASRLIIYIVRASKERLVHTLRPACLVEQTAFPLLFFKRISDVYLEEVRSLAKKLGDEELARDPKMHNFVVPDGCLWIDPADENETDPDKFKRRPA
jgi:hypothetical protein